MCCVLVGAHTARLHVRQLEDTPVEAFSLHCRFAGRVGGPVGIHRAQRLLRVDQLRVHLALALGILHDRRQVELTSHRVVELAREGGAARREERLPRGVERFDDARVLAQLFARSEHPVRIQRVGGSAGLHGRLVHVRLAQLGQLLEQRAPRDGIALAAVVALQKQRGLRAPSLRVHLGRSGLHCSLAGWLFVSGKPTRSLPVTCNVFLQKKVKTFYFTRNDVTSENLPNAPFSHR